MQFFLQKMLILYILSCNYSTATLTNLILSNAPAKLYGISNHQGSNKNSMIGEYFKTEVEFIVAFHKEDKQAYKAIFMTYYKELVYFSFKLTNDKGVAEEIVSDSFLKLFDRGKNFPSVANIKSFLYVSTRNASYDYLSKEKTRHSRMSELTYLTNEEDHTPIDYEQMNAELLARIYREIDNLPPQSQRVFRLRVLQQEEPGEVAKLLGISYQTVLNQTSIAINRLKVVKKRPLDLLFLFATLLFR